MKKGLHGDIPKLRRLSLLEYLLGVIMAWWATVRIMNSEITVVITVQDLRVLQYSRRLKRLSLGMPPMHPLLHQQSSVCLSLHYIFITSCVMCYAWSVSLFTFLGLFCFLCCSNKLDPNLLFCVGEKHAPLELELLIGFACLFLLAVSCSFSFLSCWSV